jgi:hypothetical protein
MAAHTAPGPAAEITLATPGKTKAVKPTMTETYDGFVVGVDIGAARSLANGNRLCKSVLSTNLLGLCFCARAFITSVPALELGRVRCSQTPSPDHPSQPNVRAAAAVVALLLSTERQQVCICPLVSVFVPECSKHRANNDLKVQPKTPVLDIEQIISKSVSD